MIPRITRFIPLAAGACTQPDARVFINMLLAGSMLLLICCRAGAMHDSSAVHLQVWAIETRTEIDQAERLYLLETDPLRRRLWELDAALEALDADTGFRLLLERLQLEKKLHRLEREHELKLLRLRYRKSVEIVKMLYEKILSMDHHFTSMKAQQGLLGLSNPHAYPEFKEINTLIEEKVRKKHNFEMPALLQTNPYLSTAFTLVGLMTSTGDEKDKKASLEKITCILDFTVRMHNDLNVIYYETGFLREANLSLKKECETLFSDCARQVGYTIPLASCRDSDDWERLYNMLDTYVAKSLGENAAPAPGGGAQPDNRLVQRATVNLQFSIDRVTQFIEKYSNFVSQGGEYYKKFSKIVSNYENEKTCARALPEQFEQLKNDIDQTLEKFNNAYRLPEVQGSKLKDMLYGTGVE